jgi:hypothetical protein
MKLDTLSTLLSPIPHVDLMVQISNLDIGLLVWNIGTDAIRSPCQG